MNLFVTKSKNKNTIFYHDHIHIPLVFYSQFRSDPLLRLLGQDWGEQHRPVQRLWVHPDRDLADHQLLATFHRCRDVQPCREEVQRAHRVQADGDLLVCLLPGPLHHLRAPPHEGDQRLRPPLRQGPPRVVPHQEREPRGQLGSPLPLRDPVDLHRADHPDLHLRLRVCQPPHPQAAPEDHADARRPQHAPADLHAVQADLDFPAHHDRLVDTDHRVQDREGRQEGGRRQWRVGVGHGDRGADHGAVLVHLLHAHVVCPEGYHALHHEAQEE